MGPFLEVLLECNYLDASEIINKQLDNLLMEKYKLIQNVIHANEYVQFRLDNLSMEFMFINSVDSIYQWNLCS